MIKVLIVDDSALIRQLLKDILSQDSEIEVVGIAPDPIVAMEKIERLKPDVLTLDVEMPRMDGLQFLEQLNQTRRLPVVMISSLTEKGAQTTLRALELGAIDFVTKPSIDTVMGVKNLAQEIVEKIKIAARARVGLRRVACTKPPTAPAGSKAMIRTTHKVIAIGASTGGTEALYSVLTALPADSPGIVIVQHMPPGFTSSFAQRLDSACHIRVTEARDGDRILPGHALIAPGDFHMKVVRNGANYLVRVGKAPPVNRFRPSVDVLFRSVATNIGTNAVGVILTGMGCDGAAGMLEMHQAGCATIAQDQASCVVFGMPKEAILRGGVQEVVSLERMPLQILNACNNGARSKVAVPQHSS
jgi:two-component system chemotaxis response regulator CheB